MIEILKDLELLRQKSAEVTLDEEESIIQDLVDNIKHHNSALGLACPQLSIFKRAFIVNMLDNNQYVFINPNIIWHSSGLVPSTEGCLSLTERKCVGRYQQVKVSGRIFNITNPSVLNEIRVKDRDAFVVQHEIDHLNGILIIDLPQVLTRDEQYFNRQNKKLQKKQQKKSNQVKSNQFA